jgi:uncharacterized linocin/CFP29 family protein
MTQNSSQVPWTDEQWARVKQVIQEEASRARVAATFLPLYGPLPPDTDFVRADIMGYGNPDEPNPRMTINDKKTIPLLTLQVKVYVRGAQMADPEMTSVLALFRRAANVLARLEDAVVFNGQPDPDQGPEQGIEGLPAIWEIQGGERSRGLLAPEEGPTTAVSADGELLVVAVSDSIGKLESTGHFGPFAVVLGQELFLKVQTPSSSLVLPQDRIIPFLGGGPLLRSSTLDVAFNMLSGVVVALGGAPVDLVVATDVSLTFLQLTTDPIFVFRVFEKMVLRIKEPDAIIALLPIEHTNSPPSSRRRPRPSE